jgi:uncharacterized coiled-coil DUF342 family protein
LEEQKKAKPIDVSQLPEGLRALVDIPSQDGKNAQGGKQTASQEGGAMPAHETAPKTLLSPAQDGKQAAIASAQNSSPILLPEHSVPSQDSASASLPNHSVSSSGKESAPLRPKTSKEQELDTLVSKRQEIIEQLKSKNPQVAEARKKITAMLPSVRGAGASHTMKLAEDAERIEFLIATEADTPKKERDLLKRLREIKSELSKHKEFDSARKAIDAERAVLHSAMHEIKSLERELAEVRRKCDVAYAEVLAERKSAYEQRQKGREERQHKRFEELQQRVRRERKKQYDSELAPYMKKHDDTVSMEEIVQIEKKEKKSE